MLFVRGVKEAGSGEASWGYGYGYGCTRCSGGRLLQKNGQEAGGEVSVVAVLLGLLIRSVGGGVNFQGLVWQPARRVQAEERSTHCCI